MDYGPNLHNIYMSSTYSLWNKNPVIQTEKISKTYRCTLQTDFFFTLQLEAESFDFTCSLWNPKQSRRITAAPLPAFSVGQCPLNAHQTQPAFHLHRNCSFNKNVNVLKCSLFWEISTFLCFLPGESLAWSNTEIFKCLHNDPVLLLCTLGKWNGDDRIVA